MANQGHNRPHGNAADQEPLGGELPDLLRATERRPADLSGLYNELERTVAAERGVRAWLRARSTAVRALSAAGLVAVLTALAATVYQRADMAVYPVARMALVLLVIAAGLASLLAFALRPLHRPALSGRVLAAGVGGALLALLAVYALPAAHVAHPASVHAAGFMELLQRAVPCLVAGVVLGAFVYGVLALLDRGGSRRALVAAAASGLAANLALQLHCPLTDPMHMLLGHLGVAVLLVTVAALGTWRAR